MAWWITLHRLRSVAGHDRHDSTAARSAPGAWSASIWSGSYYRWSGADSDRILELDSAACPLDGAAHHYLWTYSGGDVRASAYSGRDERLSCPLSQTPPCT